MGTLIKFILLISILYPLHYVAPAYQPDLKFKWLNPSLYQIINSEAKKNGLDPALVCAIIQNESAGNIYAVSKTGDYGLMQLNSRHWLRRGETMKDLFNPRLNIRRGCAWLRICKQAARGNLTVTIKNYNAGINGKKYRWAYINRIKKDYRRCKNV
jgi:soluble lytic murein transglycosylase-like protein